MVKTLGRYFVLSLHTYIERMRIRWASHCFPIEKAGRQDLLEMIARPSINQDIKKLRYTRVPPQNRPLFL